MTLPTKSKLTIMFCSRCDAPCGIPGMVHDCPEHRRAPWRYAEYVPADEVEEFKAALWAMRAAWAARHGEDPRFWPTDVLKALQPLGGAW